MGCLTVAATEADRSPERLCVMLPIRANLRSEHYSSPADELAPSSSTVASIDKPKVGHEACANPWDMMRSVAVCVEFVWAAQGLLARGGCHRNRHDCLGCEDLPLAWCIADDDCDPLTCFPWQVHGIMRE